MPKWLSMYSRLIVRSVANTNTSRQLLKPGTMVNSSRHNQMLRLLTGVDEQIAESESMLLVTIEIDEIRTIVERLTNLKMARQAIEAVLGAEKVPQTSSANLRRRRF